MLPLPFVSHAAVNDPNGPLLWRGRYHLFHQHIQQSVKWGWGLCWGHVSSSDLVTWQHHPPALCPTPGGADADGCFSGCAVVLPLTSLNNSNPGGSSTLRTAAGPRNVHATQVQQCGDGDEKTEQLAAVEQGVPVLLYTGVVRRPDAPPGLRPSSLAVSELCYEQQLAAVAADPGEGQLCDRYSSEPGASRVLLHGHHRSHRS